MPEPARPRRVPIRSLRDHPSTAPPAEDDVTDTVLALLHSIDDHTQPDPWAGVSTVLLGLAVGLLIGMFLGAMLWR